MAKVIVMYDSWKTIVSMIIVPMLSVALAFVIDCLGKRFGNLITVGGISLLLLIILTVSECTRIVFIDASSDDFKEGLDSDISIISERISEQTIMSGVCKEEVLALMERTRKFDEIWLVSSDLLTEINSGIYSGIIESNLKKGTKYKYFVPNTDINSVRVDILKESCKNNNNLQIYTLSDEFFFLVPNMDFAIYEPRKSEAQGRRGYMGLPIVGAEEKFAYRMNADFLDALIGKLASIAMGERSNGKASMYDSEAIEKKKNTRSGACL